MHRDRKAAFTLIELLVVIAIIAIIAAILFTVFDMAREMALHSTFLSNFKQIGSAVMIYVQDWDENYPPNRLAKLPGGGECMGGLGGSNQKLITWKTATLPYVRNIDVYRCPSNPHNREGDETKNAEPAYPTFPISYAYNGTIFLPGGELPEFVVAQAQVPEPARYLMLI